MPDLALENRCRGEGAILVAGIDEAGRGPLAGPVTAAAVILPDDYAHRILNDSKQLTPRQRAALYEELRLDHRLVIASGIANVEEIDRLNILRATHLAMARAVQALSSIPDKCLIDGLPVRGFPFPHEGVVKGDGLSLSIAAASIIAKVERDRMMEAADADYPGYGFAGHKGYGTAAHLRALAKLGPCPLHRRSFAPVGQLVFNFDGPEPGP